MSPICSDRLSQARMRRTHFNRVLVRLIVYLCVVATAPTNPYFVTIEPDTWVDTDGPFSVEACAILERGDYSTIRFTGYRMGLVTVWRTTTLDYTPPGEPEESSLLEELLSVFYEGLRGEAPLSRIPTGAEKPRWRMDRTSRLGFPSSVWVQPKLKAEDFAVVSEFESCRPASPI